MEDEGGDSFISCRACTQNCYKTHGRHSEKEHFNGPFSFFKVMMRDFAEKLHIPPELINEKEKRVVLQGPDGQEWEVETNSANNEVEFGSGWKEFVDYHSLQVGDIIVFNCIARSHMEVHMFGRSGCEKTFSVDNDKKSNIVSNGRFSSNKMHSLNQQMDNKLVIDLVSDEENIKEPEALAETHKRKKKSPRLGHSSKNPASQKHTAMESAASFKSDKPFYKVLMKSTNINRKTPYLRFERRKMQEYPIQLPNRKSEIFLLNGEGNKWKVNCIIKLDMPSLCGGWRIFVHDNNIKKGDVCIFEQLNYHQNKFMFRVHIFHNSKRKAPLGEIKK